MANYISNPVFIRALNNFVDGNQLPSDATGAPATPDLTHPGLNQILEALGSLDQAVKYIYRGEGNPVVPASEPYHTEWINSVLNKHLLYHTSSTSDFIIGLNAAMAATSVGSMGLVTTGGFNGIVSDNTLTINGLLKNLGISDRSAVRDVSDVLAITNFLNTNTGYQFPTASILAQRFSFDDYLVFWMGLYHLYVNHAASSVVSAIGNVAYGNSGLINFTHGIDYELDIDNSSFWTQPISIDLNTYNLITKLGYPLKLMGLTGTAGNYSDMRNKYLDINNSTNVVRFKKYFNNVATGSFVTYQDLDFLSNGKFFGRYYNHYWEANGAINARNENMMLALAADINKDGSSTVYTYNADTTSAGGANGSYVASDNTLHMIVNGADIATGISINTGVTKKSDLDYVKLVFNKIDSYVGGNGTPVPIAGNIIDYRAALYSDFTAFSLNDIWHPSVYTPATALFDGWGDLMRFRDIDLAINGVVNMATITGPLKYGLQIRSQSNAFNKPTVNLGLK